MGWEEVPQDDTGTYPATPDPDLAGGPTTGSPFGGVEQVDGIVYADEPLSPELRWEQEAVHVPLPPVRERPQPFRPPSAEPWKPGPDPEPAKHTTSSHTTKVLVSAVLPLVVLLVLAMIIYRVMQAYGL